MLRIAYQPHKALLFILVLILTVLLAVFSPNHLDRAGANPNKIVTENQKPGTTNWQSPELMTRDHPPLEDDDAPATTTTNKNAATTSTWTDPNTIEGYANKTSIDHGQSIDFHISTTQPSYTIDIYRFGWYGGSGARLITTISGLTGHHYSVPGPDSVTGLIEANWPTAYTLHTGTDWVSGFYQAKLTASDGSVGYIIFVVRDDETYSDILFQIPITTYQAYNNWGGKSLYDFNSDGGRASKVSYDRPYLQGSGTQYFYEGDYSLIRWLESQGYNVSYATSIDLEENANLMSNHAVFLTNYHDEYWSKPMRDHVTAARDQGKGLAFISANNVYWQIRFESSSQGVPDRVQVCYKDANADPMSNSNPQVTTVLWRDPPVNQPEDSLTGAMFGEYLGYGKYYPYVVQNASYWIYAGTGLQNGQSIPNGVSNEDDWFWNDSTTPGNLIRLSNSPTISGHTNSTASIYTASSGALVFDASTDYWAYLLDDNQFQNIHSDSRIKQMTANLLNRMIGSGPQPTPTFMPPTSTPVSGPTNTPGANGLGLKVQYMPDNTNATGTDMVPDFKIVNTGGNNIALQQLKIRYWFTIDSQSSMSFKCAYAPIGCGNVNGNFVTLGTPRTNADTYLELSFTSGAGSIAPNGGSAEIQTYNHKVDWSNFNQNNDYSFDGSRTAYADSTHITLYNNGILIWGTEPSTSGATSTPPPNVTSTPVPTATNSGISLQYMTTNTSTSTTELDPNFMIVNNTSSTIPLYQLKIRYWFTRDTPRTVLFACYYADSGCSNLYGNLTYLTTARTNADSYVEIGFNGSAGSIGAFSSSEVDTALHKNDFSSFTQTNDYSFDASRTSYANYTRVTLYQNGVLIWGTEPSGTASAATSTFIPPTP